ncbi:Synapse-associated protein [Echinococcus granulosus]|uniref:Synapse-associated protein n=1 Tax=Echinococcus granulosus TaxID=6210 RepID=W6UVW1_ECHGR|nr:Synapse-associated protein [Echinococcus granulosus]EUB57589.1 Synapse-associated protein [Echinococcus granulosus]
MLSSLRSYLAAQFVPETTELQNSNKSGTTPQNPVQEVENIYASNRDDKFVGGLKEIIALAKESSTKLAGELRNTAKQISEKISSSAPFIEFDRAQSDFVLAKKKEGCEADTSLSSPGSLLLVSSDGKSYDEKDQQRQQRVKEQILHLSLEEQNFLRPPPHGSCFQWNQQLARQYIPIATALLQEDANLAALRFRLVPRRVKEDDFWRNYFYRVSLIRQSENLPSEIFPSISKSVAAEGSQDGPATVVENEDAKPILRGPDQLTKVKAEGSSVNGSEAPEEENPKRNLSPSFSSPIALSLASDMSVDEIEAELMLEGSDLENTVVIDDNLEREILEELDGLEE